jgi:hypothetical protein
VSSVDANVMTWDVVYEDGEVESGLCMNCVRPFRPYQVDEEVGWRNSDGTYETGRIIAVNAKKQTYDVVVLTKVHKNVGSNVLRRVEKHAFIAGSHVLAFVPDEEDWFPGTIQRVNDDETFAVLFDDGDFVEDVESHHLAPAKPQIVSHGSVYA